MRYLVLVSLLFAFSCGKDNSPVRSYNYVNTDESISERLINSSGFNEGQNQTIDKTIYNDET